MSTLTKPPRSENSKGKVVSASRHPYLNSATISRRVTVEKQKVMHCNITSKLSGDDEMVELMKAKQQANEQDRREPENEASMVPTITDHITSHEQREATVSTSREGCSNKSTGREKLVRASSISSNLTESISRQGSRVQHLTKQKSTSSPSNQTQKSAALAKSDKSIQCSITKGTIEGNPLSVALNTNKSVQTAKSAGFAKPLARSTSRLSTISNDVPREIRATLSKQSNVSILPMSDSSISKYSCSLSVQSRVTTKLGTKSMISKHTAASESSPSRPLDRNVAEPDRPIMRELEKQKETKHQKLSTGSSFASRLSKHSRWTQPVTTNEMTKCKKHVSTSLRELSKMAKCASNKPPIGTNAKLNSSSSILRKESRSSKIAHANSQNDCLMSERSHCLTEAAGSEKVCPTSSVSRRDKSASKADSSSAKSISKIPKPASKQCDVSMDDLSSSQEKVVDSKSASCFAGQQVKHTATQVELGQMNESDHMNKSIASQRTTTSRTGLDGSNECECCGGIEPMSGNKPTRQKSELMKTEPNAKVQKLNNQETEMKFQEDSVDAAVLKGTNATKSLFEEDNVGPGREDLTPVTSLEDVVCSRSLSSQKSRKSRNSGSRTKLSKASETTQPTISSVKSTSSTIKKFASYSSDFPTLASEDNKALRKVSSLKAETPSKESARLAFLSSSPQNFQKKESQCGVTKRTMAGTPGISSTMMYNEEIFQPIDSVKSKNGKPQRPAEERNFICKKTPLSKILTEMSTCKNTSSSMNGEKFPKDPTETNVSEDKLETSRKDLIVRTPQSTPFETSRMDSIVRSSESTTHEYNETSHDNSDCVQGQRENSHVYEEPSKTVMIDNKAERQHSEITKSQPSLCLQRTRFSVENMKRRTLVFANLMESAIGNIRRTPDNIKSKENIGNDGSPVMTKKANKSCWDKLKAKVVQNRSFSPKITDEKEDTFMIIFEEVPPEQDIVSCASIEKYVEVPMATDARTVVKCSSKNEIEICYEQENSFLSNKVHGGLNRSLGSRSQSQSPESAVIELMDNKVSVAAGQNNTTNLFDSKKQEVKTLSNLPAKPLTILTVEEQISSHTGVEVDAHPVSMNPDDGFSSNITMGNHSGLLDANQTDEDDTKQTAIPKNFIFVCNKNLNEVEFRDNAGTASEIVSEQYLSRRRRFYAAPAFSLRRKIYRRTRSLKSQESFKQSLECRENLCKSFERLANVDIQNESFIQHDCIDSGTTVETLASIAKNSPSLVRLNENDEIEVDMYYRPIKQDGETAFDADENEFLCVGQGISFPSTGKEAETDNLSSRKCFTVRTEPDQADQINATYSYPKKFTFVGFENDGIELFEEHCTESFPKQNGDALPKNNHAAKLISRPFRRLRSSMQRRLQEHILPSRTSFMHQQHDQQESHEKDSKGASMVEREDTMHESSFADIKPTVFVFGQDSLEANSTFEGDGIEWDSLSLPIDMLDNKDTFIPPDCELQDNPESRPAPKVFTFVGFENLNEIEVSKKDSEENCTYIPKQDGFLPKWKIAAKNMITLKKVRH